MQHAENNTRNLEFDDPSNFDPSTNRDRLVPSLQIDTLDDKIDEVEDPFQKRQPFESPTNVELGSRINLFPHSSDYGSTQYLREPRSLVDNNLTIQNGAKSGKNNRDFLSTNTMLENSKMYERIPSRDLEYNFSQFLFVT